MRNVFGAAGVIVAAILTTGIPVAGILTPSPAWSQQTPTADTTNTASPQSTTPAAEPTMGAAIAARASRFAAINIDRGDVAGLQAYYSANPEKVLWLEGGRFNDRARAVMAEIGRADDWGLAAASIGLPADAIGAGPEAEMEAEARLSLAVLTYARHARGGRIEPTRLSDNLDREPNLLEPMKVLEGIAKAPEADAWLRRLHPQHPQFERLRQLYLALRAGTYQPEPAPPVAAATVEPETKGRKRKKSTTAKKPSQPPPVTMERVLVNMEQWRWMPAELGGLHAVVNIPEFTLRVVKDKDVIFTERVVVGTPTNQTPIFSKQMQTVVFQPGWGVPPGIKVKELLPRLLAGGDPISSRGLVVRHRGREVHPQSIDWRSVDIRRVSIVQPPGPANALGMVKFLFPNKHDVYMHDTPSKSLFNAETRAFSHGCVRVRNPMRFAEVVFAETGGWAPTRVAGLVRGKPENEVAVPGPLHVHLTYFTVTVGDDGKVNSFRDLYGHELRIKAGLEGRGDKVARKSDDLGQIRSQLIGRVRPTRNDRRVVANGPVPQPRAATSRPRPVRSATVARSGGGSFNLFGGF